MLRKAGGDAPGAFQNIATRGMQCASRFWVHRHAVLIIWWILLVRQYRFC